MVGLVIVSHSKDLADALIALVKQVSSNDIPIAGAAGVGTERQEFGTDAVAIVEAIQTVYSGAGVLILMDLGSAILSAEMALEFLPEAMQSHIRFCAAPLVEGAISAGVQISLESDLDTVYREAQQSLRPKIDQLVSSDEELENLESARESFEQEIILAIDTPHGLHARPAARFIQTAAQFNAEIQVSKWQKEGSSAPVAATSLSNLMTLGIVRGDHIVIQARGNETSQALEALRRLVEAHFGENIEGSENLIGDIGRSNVSKLSEGPGQDTSIIPLSEGIAIGPVFHYQAVPVHVSDHQGKDPEREWQNLQDALHIAQKSIEERQQTTQTLLGNSQAAIFEAHLFILTDQALLDKARNYIFEHHFNAAFAWDKGIHELVESYQAIPDPYLQQRANDVLDVGNQVLALLAGDALEVAPILPEPGILITQELTPTLVAQLEPTQVLGLITMNGGPTDHSAILARALGIPTILVPSLFQQSRQSPLEEETLLAIDAFAGNLWIQPSQEILDHLQQRRIEWQAKRKQLIAVSHQAATTSDGETIAIAANAGSELDAEIAVRNGAEGIGVLRTEFLYLTRTTAPTESEQLEMLVQIGNILQGQPVYVRTLDIGGDKALPYLDLPQETNPFLGVRSIRLSLRSPEIFLTQLRAILRAGAQNDIRVMFPMVSTVEEIIDILNHLNDAHQTLEQKQMPHRWPIETAMMIETPSAALLTAAFAKYIDYFSVGTNDLTQYTLAAERGNSALADYADGLHPAVLYLIKHVVKAAHHQNKYVGVCGELAGDPLAVPILLGLGVDELSLNPASIPQVKALIRQLDMKAARNLAAKALQTDSAKTVRSLAEEFYEKNPIDFLIE